MEAKPIKRHSSRRRHSSRSSSKNSNQGLWVLGKSYDVHRHREEIRSHCESFFRFTYRRDFTPLAPYTISSDAGWGCMLRSAQMMMGYTLRQHYLGPNWRLPLRQKDRHLASNYDYCNMVQWFVDHPGPPHIYALHHMIQCGMRYDKLPGEWYGPSTAALVLRDLTHLHRVKYGGQLEVLVTQGDTIYISEVEKLCSNLSLDDCLLGLTQTKHFLLEEEHGETTVSGDTSAETTNQQCEVSESIATTIAAAAATEGIDAVNTEADTAATVGGRNKFISRDAFFDPLLNPPPSAVAPWSHALMVIIPLLLGLGRLNSEYIEELKEILRHQNCVGILGGRPHHAIYFVGYNGDTLLGHDPHTVFATPNKPPPPACDEAEHQNTKFQLNEFISQVHVHDFVKLNFEDLDPSLAIGFYFRDRSKFETFCSEMRQKVAAKISAGQRPLFDIQHTAPSFCFGDTDTNTQRSSARSASEAATHNIDNDAVDEFDMPEQVDDDNDDEYVFI